MAARLLPPDSVTFLMLEGLLVLWLGQKMTEGEKRGNAVKLPGRGRKWHKLPAVAIVSG